MSEHTPGPWRAGYLDEKDRAERMIVRAEQVDGQPYVAICPNPLVGSHGANARLIAAAPALLAACEAWDKIMDAIGYIRTAELMLNGLPADAGDKAIELTHEALKLARGEG